MEKKGILMQYPFDPSGANRLWDGHFHEVFPRSLRRVELYGREFYVMVYYDATCEAEGITVLTRIGNNLAKVPLDNYNVLFEYLEEHKVPELDISEIKFPPRIPLATTIRAEDLFGQTPQTETETQMQRIDPPWYGNGPKIPVFTHTEYVPISPNGIRCQTYRSSYSDQEPYSTVETFAYEKEPTYAEKDEKIDAELSRVIANHLDGHEYEFEILIEKPTPAIIPLEIDGKLVERLCLLVPGLHKYKIIYGFCNTDQTFLTANRATLMDVDADLSDFPELYGDEEGKRKVAFLGGIKGYYPTKFYTGLGQKIGQTRGSY